ncbi:glutaredoxin family protein [Granulicoccus sp. GXG6511]|uniref:glutaredoxin family protein n=1 Tax=Granulicoccus sp. GXG6511 TaxID=3381351 RepID=UPI003D7F0DF3
MAPERNKTALLTIVTGALGAAALGLWLGKMNLWLGIVAALLVLLGVGALVRRVLQPGRHTPWAEARTRLAPGHAVVLWKPTCAYCEQLLRAVGDDSRVTWVNVWADPAANRAVRDVNDGNELTPTALVGSGVMRNPSRAELMTALADHC